MNSRIIMGGLVVASCFVSAAVVALLLAPRPLMEGVAPNAQAPTIVMGFQASSSRPLSSLVLTYPEASFELPDGRILIANALGFTVEMVDGDQAETVVAMRRGNGDRPSVYTDFAWQEATGSVLILNSSAGQVLRFDPETRSTEVAVLAPTVESEYPDAYVWLSSIDERDGTLLATGAPVVPRSDVASYSVGQSQLWLWRDGAWTDIYTVAPSAGRLQFRDAKLLPSGDVVAVLGERFVRIRGGRVIAAIDISATYGGGILETPDGGYIVGAHTRLLKVNADLTEATEVAFPIPIANVGHIASMSGGRLAVTDTDRQIVAVWDRKNGGEDNGTVVTLGNAGAALKVVSLAADDGNLLALENATPRVLKYSGETGEVFSLAGSGRQGYDAPKRAEDFSFQYPSGLAVRGDGALFVTEANYRIAKVQDGQVSIFAGDVHPGEPVEGALASGSRFGSLRGMDFDDSGNLFVADEGNHSVYKIAPDGTISRIMGTGEPGTWEEGIPAKGQPLSHPLGVLVRSNGSILVADSYNNTIVEISPDGIASCFAGSRSSVTYQGYGTYGGDGGPACAAHLNTPTSIAEDAAGNVYINDQFNNRVRMVGLDDVITTVAGGKQGFALDGAHLNLPQSVAVVGEFLYIADTGNSVVWAFPLE